jgi:very-short-patch-repair endonuclease
MRACEFTWTTKRGCLGDMPPARYDSTELQAIIERLKSIAQQQSGVVHRSQCLEEGLSGDQILRLKARGWIEARFRWTYAFPGTGHAIATRSWSAVLSAGGDAVVSHAPALALLDVLPERDGPMHCLRSDGRPRAQPGLIVHKVDQLPREDIVGIGGIRCAAFHRAVWSICVHGHASDVDRALDRGVHRRLFDQARFDRLLRDVGPVPGRLVLEAALGRLDATSGRNRSELERRLSALIRASDLPTPSVNVIVGGFELDNHWIGTRGIVEADGRDFHRSPADIARDIEKQRALEALGYVFLRLTWHHVTYEPERTVERIRAFLLANLAPPVPRLAAE